MTLATLTEFLRFIFFSPALSFH